MKYFQYEEFDSPDIQGSGQMMSKELLSKLDMVREEYGKPIHINSGYRTEAHNEKVGGKPASSHLKGLAADIACSSSRERFNLVKLFIEHGINRIGIAKNFIHIDIDDDKDQDVIWVY
ncbi:MAG: peptidase M15 [Alteromonadales bacterium]|jgi:uncharacterized protein YcbK (DUF882 family)|nr:peptidase M15 [Alteromonadales bacterium]